MASIAQLVIARPQGDSKEVNSCVAAQKRTRCVCDIVMSHLGSVATGIFSSGHGIKFALHS